MYAVVVKITVNDREAAEKTLHEEVVPRVSQLPGFVAGYWTRSEGADGLSMAGTQFFRLPWPNEQLGSVTGDRLASGSGAS